MRATLAGSRSPEGRACTPPGRWPPTGPEPLPTSRGPLTATRDTSKGSPVPFPPPPPGGFPEERVVWVFGHPRSGTTWLVQLLTDGLNLRLGHEPHPGQILGLPHLL